MKAEITKGPLGYAVAVRDEDGYLERELLLCEDSALAIHAALTEWKAKREEKPKEAKWRAWKSGGEVPIDIKFVRFKTDIHKTPKAVACVHGCTVWIKYKSVETDLSLHGLSLWCEWSNDGVNWFPCGAKVE